MRDLAALTVDDFLPLQGHTFRATADGQAVDLVLEEAAALGQRPGHRQPFSLLFRGPAGVVLPQQLYRLAHDDVGEVEVLMVPVVGDGQGNLAFEVIFT